MAMDETGIERLQSIAESVRKAKQLTAKAVKDIFAAKLPFLDENFQRVLLAFVDIDPRLVLETAIAEEEIRILDEHNPHVIRFVSDTLKKYDFKLSDSKEYRFDEAISNAIEGAMSVSSLRVVDVTKNQGLLELVKIVVDDPLVLVDKQNDPQARFCTLLKSLRKKKISTRRRSDSDFGDKHLLEPTHSSLRIAQVALELAQESFPELLAQRNKEVEAGVIKSHLDETLGLLRTIPRVTASARRTAEALSLASAKKC